MNTRKNVRLKEYDYGNEGAYFVTICTHNRLNLFWKDLSDLPFDDEPDIKLNNYGKIIKNVWLRSEQIYKDVTLDVYAIMPNHFHGIVIKQKTSEITIARIVGQFKSVSAKEIHKHEPCLQVWQRNYHEHVIRENDSYEIQRYVIGNPYNFNDDMYFIRSGGSVTARPLLRCPR